MRKKWRVIVISTDNRFKAHCCHRNGSEFKDDWHIGSSAFIASERAVVAHGAHNLVHLDNPMKQGSKCVDYDATVNVKVEAE